MWGFVAEALWENGHLRHVVNSQQGVPQELVDDNGKLIWQGTFDDWGKLIDEKGSTTCRLRLPGQLADDETGLHYNRFRYYSPEAGQFVSADPIGFRGGTNSFRYAPNCVRWVDVLGLVCNPKHKEKVQQVVPADLHAFGSKTNGPRPPRIDNESGRSDIRTDPSGLIQSSQTQGASTFADPSQAPLSGAYHVIPAGTQLPDGLGVIADGKDVMGPHAPTHHTIVPTRAMTPAEFTGLVAGLPWTFAGAKK